MNTINVENCKTLSIGRRGENEVTTVAFDFTEWQAEFGSGVVDLYVKRFGDDSAYPVVLTIDGTVASWLVTETDTNVAGYGKAEYVYRVDGKIAKSAVFLTCVMEDIGQPTSTPPDPYESWLEQLTALGAETQANAQAAQTAQANAESFAAAASGAEAAAETAQGKAEDAQDAAEAAQATAESAKAGALAAQGAAETAQGKAEDAQAAAEQAAQDAHVEYEQLSGEVDDLSDEVADQKSAIEAHEQYAEETYAKQDGTYEDLTAGNAYELLSDRGDTNQQPYLFQQTGGDSSAYNREQVRKIVGGTVAFNQLIKPRQVGTTSTDKGITYSVDSNFAINTSGTVEVAGYSMFNTNSATITVQKNHIYLLIGCPSGGSETTFRLWVNSFSAFPIGKRMYDFGKGHIAVAQENETITNGVAIQIWASAGSMDGRKFSACFFDLTQMFGTAIADYIYSLEQATAGAGVAFFRSLFPADYYDYNPGELMSVEGVSSHDTVGFNLFDLSQFAELYPTICTMSDGELNCVSTAVLFSTGVPVDNVFSDTQQYYVTVELKTETATNVRLRLMYEDGGHQELGGTNMTTYVKYSAPFSRRKRLVAVRINWTQAGTFSVRNLCINLSDPKRNGTYEPYKKRTYPLDSSLTLRGVPKLDSNNRLYYDGDTYEPDGMVTRRYGVVDLGTLDWLWYSNVSRFAARISRGITGGNGYGRDTAINKIYPVNTITYNNMADKTMLFGSNFYSASSCGCVVRDDSFNGDAAAFKAAMSGVMLVYELATTTTETADPYRELEICDRDGTEEFVSTSIVPVGHETFYPVNVFDYIDRLTEPDADMIADSVIAANKYFSVGNRLFLSTASIAAGAQIIPGTNCTETSLAAALNALNA